MASTIGFTTVQTYLDGLADANGSIDGSPHKAFWRITYDQFITANVPGVKCQGADIPIINTSKPEESAFFLIMLGSWCGKPQMPKDGPFFISNDDDQIPIGDGTVTVSGKQMRQDLRTWLVNGFPKDPKVIP